MNPALEQLAHRIAGALFNGLYQGLLLAAVLWLGLRLCRGVNAATRHAVNFFALLLVALLPVVHFFWPAAANQSETGANVDLPAMDTMSGNGTRIEPTPNEAAALVVESPTDGQHSPSIPEAPVLANPFPPSSMLPDEPMAGDSPPAVNPEMPHELAPFPITSMTDDSIILGSGLPHLPEATTPDAVQEPLKADTKPATSLLPFKAHVQTWKAAVPGFVSVFAVVAVALIATVRLLRLGIQLIMLRRLKRQGAPASGDLADLFDNLCCESQLNRPVRLLVSDQIVTPMAVGYLRPVVLLPAELVASADNWGLQSVLRHELAHVQRRDDWINLIQQFIHAGLFFHPAVWWLSRRLTIDREIACDDHALARLESRHDYALFLTEFAGRSRGHDWIAAPAAWRKRSHLKERINMILDTKRNTSLRLARTSAGVITFATLATAAVALIAGPRLVLAESSASATTGTTTPASSDNSSSASSSVSVHWNAEPSSDEPVSASAASSDSEPVTTHTHAAVTLRNSGLTIAAPIEVHPRVDTVVQVADVRPRVIVAQGLPPLEPEEPSAPKGPKPPSAGYPKPMSTPDPAALPTPPDRHRDSLEGRIDRLERMIEKLTDERRAFHMEFSPDEWKAKNFAFTDKDKAKWKDKNLAGQHDDHLQGQIWNSDEHFNWKMSGEQQEAVEKAMKDAQQEMARAMKGVEQKARQAEHQAQMQATLAQEHYARSAESEARRQALEKQKQTIERQMDEMNRQLEKLDQQMDRLDDQMERLDEQADNENENADHRHDNRNEDSLPKLKEKQKN